MRDKLKLVRAEKPIVISLLDDGGNCRPQALADAVNFARSGKMVQLLAVWAETNTRRAIAEDVAWAKSVIASLSVSAHEFSFVPKKIDDNWVVIMIACDKDTTIKTEPTTFLDRVALHTTLDGSVDTLEFSVRAANCLRNEKIRFVGEIVSKTDQDLLRSKNIGKRVLTEIKLVLAELNLVPGMDTQGWMPPTRR